MENNNKHICKNIDSCDDACGLCSNAYDCFTPETDGEYNERIIESRKSLFEDIYYTTEVFCDE